MQSIHEQASAQFAALERRGRGWRLYEEPVALEPPYRPFEGYSLQTVADESHVPFLGEVLLNRFNAWLSRKKGNLAPAAPPPLPPEEPVPEPFARTESLVELQTALPANLDIRGDAFNTFLSQLAACSDPVAFELLGNSERIVTQFAVAAHDAPIVRRQLLSYFPEVLFLPQQDTLENNWFETGPNYAVVDFGLEQECLKPLVNGSRIDPFIGLIGAMNELAREEMALFQVLFQPTRHNWAGSLIEAVSDQGKPFFVNRGDLLSNARTKVASPLFGAVVRIATRAETLEKAWVIAKELAFSLRVYSSFEGNCLVPLHNEGYQARNHADDILRRQTRRSAMLLNMAELSALVHFPSPAVRSPKLQRHVERTKAAPEAARKSEGLELGVNSHMGDEVTVRLAADQRVRHTHIIGATATGKSTLLFNLIRQDIENGAGVGVLDPHGDLIDRILGIIPEERMKDVVLVDPSDEEYSVGFNILSAHSDREKNQLASDLVSVFQRLSTTWGDQMGSVLNNAILAFLESSRGGTLTELRRFLIEPQFRERFLETVQDPDIVYYWKKGFTQLSGNKSIGPVLTRLDTFLAPKPIRYMVSQPVNRLDFTTILDSGRIFLAKLSQGQMGKENSFLLGSLMMAKFQQAAMARQQQETSARRDFWLYVDEFHNFITPSIAEILSGARKYRLGLILAHQELRQMDRDREVASAVMSNPYTRIVFRVGDDDARKLADGFSYFEARDLQNLETGRAICRVEKAGGDFNLSVPKPEEPEPQKAAETRRKAIAESRRRYATPRQDIAAALAKDLFGSEAPDSPAAAPFSPAKETPESTRSRTPVAAAKEKKTAPIDPTTPVPQPETPTTHSAPAPFETADRSKTPKSPETIAEAPSSPAKPDAPESNPPQPLAPTPTPVDGSKHKALKRQITVGAESLGYIVTEEEPVPGSQGRADLVLRRAERVIACEISVTTNAEEELSNITKCLSGGYPQIVLISTSERKLRNIEARMRETLTADDLARIHFQTPENLLDQLRAWAQGEPETAPGQPPQPRKRTILFTTPQMTESQRHEYEKQMLTAMAQQMKANRPKSN